MAIYGPLICGKIECYIIVENNLFCHYGKRINPHVGKFCNTF